MAPKKRGQPPKPPELKRTREMMIRHTESKRELLEEAYRLSGSERTLAKWVATITVEEAQKIIDSHKK